MKKFYSLLIALLCSATIAFAKIEIDGIYYNLNDETKTAEVTSNSNKYFGDITIPEKIIYNTTEYSVTSIDSFAFEGCISLKSITIPNSVTSIGDQAFGFCSSLTSITIPESVTSIGDHAFYSCSSLSLITISNSVTSIGNSAFLDCSSLASIEIPNSVTSIGDNAFLRCSSLTSITIPNSVTSIGDQAFGSCSSLSLITISNSVTSIGNLAFLGCSSLTSITIPESVTSIGDYAFASCSSLTSITIPESVTSIGGHVFDGTPWLENQPAGCVYINDCLYVYKGEMPENTHIDVKDGTILICGSAFENCSFLTSITIPNSVISIGMRAFEGCSALASITIPNSVTSIGELAFHGCSSLSSIELHDSVISIGSFAFSECLSLSTIDVDENNPNYASIDGVLYDKNITTLIACPGAKTEVIIQNSVTSIEKNAFYGCSSLTLITIQVESPLTIGRYTFYGVSRSILLKVPCGSITKYQTAEYWKEFVNYKEVPTVTLTVDVNDKTMGFATITKQNNCTDDVAQVQAQALAGYEFVRWSDGATENPHILLVTEDMTITAEFRVAGTGLENSVISSASVYGNNGVLYVEGVETDYHVLDVAGRLIYSGHDAQLHLPRGVYMIAVGSKIQKVVL